MPVHNRDISKILGSMADLLDIGGDNPFRIRAYRNAARIISTLSRPLAEMVEEGEDLTGIYGIGEDLAKKIATIVSTGELPALEKLERQIPPSLLKLLNIPGLGPRRVGRIHELLGVTDLDGLKRAAAGNRIRELPGFGGKTQAMILDALEEMGTKEERMLLMEADELSTEIIDHIKGLEGVRNAAVAGSLRRRRETVGDIDILVSARREPMWRDTSAGMKILTRSLKAARRKRPSFFEKQVFVSMSGWFHMLPGEQPLFTSPVPVPTISGSGSWGRVKTSGSTNTVFSAAKGRSPVKPRKGFMGRSAFPGSLLR